MKPLYFAASAPSQIAPALSGQVHESLRPYTAYLKAALTAAVKREARSACQWELVPREYAYRLEPADSLICLESEGFTYRIAGWDGEVPTMPMFAGMQYRPVSPKSSRRDGADLVVVLAEALAAGEPVFWVGRPCTLSPIPAAGPTRLVVQRAGGKSATILRRREGGSRLLLVVEGAEACRVLDERGTEIPHATLDPHEGAATLRVGSLDLAWKGERTIRLTAPPETELLPANNGVRWWWSDDQPQGRRRRGVWIQLLPPDEVDSEATMDIRAAYCEEGVREVRARKGRNSPPVPCKVWGVRRDNYQLELDRAPPEGSTLFVPSSTSGLRRQRQAVFRLKDSPLPHHRGLLTLCEDPGKVRWPRCRPAAVKAWQLLRNEELWGTAQQREFVEKALGTAEFAFLEGPPGSGKTHAICELVLQLIEREQRVLLCSTTHVAVDNVVERLVGHFPQVEAVRIGLADRVDQAVREVQIDERIATLCDRWRDSGTLAELDDDALERAAEGAILASANLTCGTTTGILAHPYIRRTDDARDDEGGPRWPYFDVLILDEASKTTLQEFLVPAQLAKRWIVVGDVRQLPPFSEPKDLEASIAEVNEESGASLPDAHQVALLILHRLLQPEAGGGRVRWLIEEPDEVLAALAGELTARQARGDRGPEFAWISAQAGVLGTVPVEALDRGQPEALRVAAADWILFAPHLRDRVERHLPADAQALRDWGAQTARAYRFARWHQRHGTFDRPVEEKRARFVDAAQLAERQRTFFREESWAKQVAWRLGRVHQLAQAQNAGQRERRQSEVEALMPAAAPFAAWVPAAIDAIRDVGVRSVIEALRVPREHHRVRKSSALTDAIPPEVWDERAVLLEYQHRMHPDISGFPRDQFYQGEALKDANTLDGRDAHVGWTFLSHAPGRRIWDDVRGEDRGTNEQEIDATRRWLERWREFAAANRRADGKDWEVACLSFYNRQELGTRDMLRRLTGLARAETRFALPNTSLVCATVDRFQGREADLVLLSLRNTTRPGHMDSPNRLNVALTRARFLLVVIGHRKYYAELCPSEELNAVADATPAFSTRNVR